jgi:hypothetical protein
MTSTDSSTGQGSTGQGSTGQGSTGQGSTGQARATFTAIDSSFLSYSSSDALLAAASLPIPPQNPAIDRSMIVW